MNNLFELNQRKVGKKPIGGYEIDWCNPLTRGLANGLPITEVGGTETRDIVLDEVSGITRAVLETQYVRFYQTNGRIQVNSKALPDGHTLLVVYAPNDTTSGYISDFSGSDEFSIIRDYQPGYYNVFGGSYPIGGNAANSQMPISGVGVKDVVIYSRSASDNIKGYVNGIKYVDGTATGGDVTPSAGLRLGSHYVFTPFTRGNIYAAFLWDRQLSDAESVSIGKNPYQFLKPVRTIQSAVYAALFSGADGPITVDDAYSVTSGQLLTVPVESGILINDTYVCN